MASFIDIDPTLGTEDAPDSIQPPPDEAGPSPNPKNPVDQPQGGANRKLGRRSKSGCLTCRKRRIKCDESRPTCGNCIKSKRQCEGYSQRVSFKEPLKGHPRPLLPGPFPLLSRDSDDTSTWEVENGLYDLEMCGPVGEVADWSADPLVHLNHPLGTTGKDLSVPAKEFHTLDLDFITMSLDRPSDEDDDEGASSPNYHQLQIFLIEGLGGQPASGQKGPQTSVTTYRPSAQDSPLTNWQTAAVFWHFVNVVAPTISLYESSGMYNGRFALVKPIPVKVPYAAPEVSLWTESFPMMSFHHPALLQAMLALSSLHIAKLQQVPPTAAMKHYHLALRRTARNIQDPFKKAHPATAACMLLLAYFEMWMPDVERWRNHLNGLSQLFNDRPSVNAGAVVVTAGESSFTVQRPANEDILGAGSSIASGRRSPEEFDQLREVYWSLFRMDIFQSFVGGKNPFIARPRARSQYPPRGGIGDLIAIHGTSDNLFLLLRKVADFATEVRRCKGAELREPGVVVDASTEKEDSARSIDLIAAQRREAIGRNLARLQQDFEDFKRHLGEEYHPLDDESFPAGPLFSPFGPSQQFRSYAVAGIWMNFYMGLIHLRRLEPSPPQQEMAAPEVSERIAQDTAPFVDHICQIAAGLMADMDVADSTATPAHAAALIESCVPLSIAGAKITDMSKRDWVVQYLLDVERLTGCQLATYAREACESCWVEMAASGWGPPYLKLEDSAASGKSREKGRHNVRGKIRNRSLASPVVYQDEQYDVLGLFALEGNLDKLNLTEGGGARNDGRLGTSQYTTRNPSTKRVQGVEGWKRAAEVTSQLKARIEQMKVGQLQSEQSASTRDTGDTGDIMALRQQIMDKKAHLLDLKRGRAYQKRLEGGKFEITETLASQFGEQSNATVKRLNLPIQPKQERGERPGVDGSMKAPETETSVAVTTSDLGTDDSSWSMEETDDESQASTIKSEGVVDPAARVLRIVERNKQRVVKEVAQYCRRIIGNRQLAQLQGHAVGDGVDNGEDQPPSGSSKQGKSIASSSGGGRAHQRKTQSKARRGRGDDDDREGDERDERRPNKKPRVSADGTAAEGLKLACPYFKRNPKAPRIGQSCAGPGWNTIHRLKEHLYRRHVCVRCLRCSGSFHSEDDLVAHSRAATACTVSCTPIDPDDGFEKHQEVLLRRRWKVMTTTEEQWRQVYKILFPDDSEDLMPSPYYQDHRTMTDEFARFELFLRRETSRLLEERLNESLLDGNANLDPASLAGQLSAVVNEIQSQAIRSYRDSSQVEFGVVPHPGQGQEDGSHGTSDRATAVLSPHINISEILARTPGPNLGQDSSTPSQQTGNTGQESSTERFDAENTAHDLESWYDLSLSTDFDFGEIDEAGNWTGNNWDFEP